MTTKLTLTIEKSVIEAAKRYASQTGRSLSDLIESYLETVVKKHNPEDSDKMPSDLKKLFGAVHIPADLDHKKEIRKILSSKGAE